MRKPKVIGLTRLPGVDGDQLVLADVTLLDGILSAFERADLPGLANLLGDEGEDGRYFTGILDEGVPMGGACPTCDSSEGETILQEGVLSAVWSAAKWSRAGRKIVARLEDEGLIEHETGMDWNAYVLTDPEAIDEVFERLAAAGLAVDRRLRELGTEG